MYLTRNQAGVYSASGVRIPPSPPDKEKGLPKGGPFSLSGVGRAALCASPHTLLRNLWAPPFAGLSPPLSGQPLNRGACCSRWFRAWWRGHRWLSCLCRNRRGLPKGSPFSLIWRGMRRALRAAPETLRHLLPAGSIHAWRARGGHAHRVGTPVLCEWRVLRTCSPVPAVCRSGSGRRAVRPHNRPSPTGACWHGWSRPGSRPGPAHRRSGCWH